MTHDVHTPHTHRSSDESFLFFVKLQLPGNMAQLVAVEPNAAASAFLFWADRSFRDAPNLRRGPRPAE